MTSKFFDFFTNSAEQYLFESLIVESIHIYGVDCFYLPRTTYNKDEPLNEFEYYGFRDAIQTEFYVKNIDGFEGDGLFLQKFGLEIRDQITLTVALRTFDADVLPFVDITRPREGDLIYVPFLKAAYQIKYVETASLYYQLGSVRTYDLVCDLYEYSNEFFDTGIEVIDTKYNKYNGDLVSKSITDEVDIPLASEGDTILIDESASPDPQNVYADNDALRKQAKNWVK